MKELVIGDITARVPIVQGGMGVGVSLHRLAGAVAKQGGIGVISAAQPGFRAEDFATNVRQANIKALSNEIKLAKEQSDGGIIGVNIMVAMQGYEDFVHCAIDAGADIIISGAGLPMDLPKFAAGSNIKLAPIVSSAKAAKVILTRWAKQEDVTADMVVIEGPKAGGHLGFKADEVEGYTDEMMDAEIAKILEVVAQFEEKYSKKIPVIFGGGVYTREDIDHYMSLGLDGVQMATRFVATEECDADINFKMAYVNAKKEDIQIVKSPVGMPGRAIVNDFIRRTRAGKDPIEKCYGCLAKCNPKEIPYCISQALFKAANGDTDNALLFCGENAYRVDKITTVKEIFDELTKE
jgi:NAD(P)H-dependent flavin oxidoreductase YrpB (nitropropane dioxygenase family)